MSRTKKIIAFIVGAAILVLALVAVAGVILRISDRGAVYTGTVRHQSCINQGAPCLENYIELDGSTTRCSIGSEYISQYKGQRVEAKGIVSTNDFGGQGPEVCSMDIKSIRRLEE